MHLIVSQGSTHSQCFWLQGQCTYLNEVVPASCQVAAFLERELHLVRSLLFCFLTGGALGYCFVKFVLLCKDFGYVCLSKDRQPEKRQEMQQRVFRPISTARHETGVIIATENEVCPSGGLCGIAFEKGCARQRFRDVLNSLCRRSHVKASLAGRNSRKCSDVCLDP